ncbi:MAG: hypothetical protein EHM37_05190 [Deltaproteobacteria bacterium]|nr:MAG: hypothetical protein EHM37_05190 [Deltaproteobacteria bacterium]
MGSVASFGSIIVNDVEFDTTNAEVVVEGEVRGTGDAAVTILLSQGMVVRVEGRLDGERTGTAARVVFNDNVEGPVERVTTLDALVTELVVMGQTVRVDDRTVFQNATLGAIGVGNVLEVSGLVDEAGTIFASYVNKKSDSLTPRAPVELKGIVQNLNTITGRFTINSLTIDYTTATVSGFSGADPQQGKLAEIKGRLIDPDTLAATSVVLENELGRDDIDTAEIEGFVTQFTSISRFAVGTVVIATDGATVFNDVVAEDLGVGTRLKIRGSLNSRIVLADEVALADKVKLESDVDSVNMDPQGDSLSLVGLSPVVVQTNASTKFTGVIVVGSHVKIFGRTTGSNEVIATKVLEKPGSGTVVLKGPAGDIMPPSLLKVLGVEINTSTIPKGSFFGKDGGPVSSDEFFSSLKTGDTVNAQGTWAGLGVTWNAIESE